ncbi:MAG: hypothetical protein WCJ64_04860 [Rhodospirillaceae bacterium]
MHERDQEVEDFIRTCPTSMIWSEIVQAIQDRFGEARAWSRTRIVNFWNRVRDASKGRPGKLERDPELARFVEDRLGRMPLHEIEAACRKEFGARAPGRSSIHRYHQKLRGAGPYRKLGRHHAKP